MIKMRVTLIWPCPAYTAARLLAVPGGPAARPVTGLFCHSVTAVTAQGNKPPLIPLSAALAW